LIFLSTGQKGYERLRGESYPGTDIFIICFSIDDKDSLTNVGKWHDEVCQYDQSVPILLVGTKTDMRETGIECGNFVEMEEAMTLANNIGAIGYLECSALAKVAVKKVFDEALQFVLFPWSKLPVQSTICNILWYSDAKI